MSLSDELNDPWGLVVAGLTAGLAWAVDIPLPLALAAGTSAFGVKVVLGSLLNRPRKRGARKLAVRFNSAEAQWLGRGSRAVQSLRRLAESVLPGPVADRTQEVAAEARETLAAMERLAGQVSAVGFALGHIDLGALMAERAGLANAQQVGGDEQTMTEVARSLEAVESQLAVHTRLVQAERALLARLQSGALGLEGLVARLAEVLALTEAVTAPQTTQQVGELAEELEGLRRGLTESEEATRNALSAFNAQDTVPDQVTRTVNDLAERRPAASAEGG